jgi:hypothetical protein
MKLFHLGFERIISELSDGDVLLCHCTAFCHRHLLANFLRSYGIEVEELEYE